jgi:hypothetical protein
MKIAFYKHRRSGLNGAFDAAVRWWTNGPYSHCEVVLHIDADGQHWCASASKQDGGVRIKSMSLPENKWDFVHLPDLDAVAAKRWFAEHIGESYDTLGLLGFVWRRGLQRRKSWFCSEACAAACGFFEPWRYDPNGLHATLAAFERLFYARIHKDNKD